MSRETISKITDQIVDDMGAWQSRPLDSLHAVLLIDCLVIKGLRLSGRDPQHPDRSLRRPHRGQPDQLKSMTATATYTTKLTVPVAMSRRGFDGQPDQG